MQECCCGQYLQINNMNPTDYTKDSKSVARQSGLVVKSDRLQCGKLLQMQQLGNPWSATVLSNVSQLYLPNRGFVVGRRREDHKPLQDFE